MLKGLKLDMTQHDVDVDVDSRVLFFTSHVLWIR